MKTDWIDYAPLEWRILNAIPDDGTKISTVDLTLLVYVEETPHNGRQSVLDSANKLVRKVDLNQEAFEIFRSKARGSMPIYFWKEPRRKRERVNFFGKRGASPARA